MSGTLTTASSSVVATIFASSPRLCAGLSFHELPVPAAEHPARLLDAFRESSVFLRVERFRFPEHHQEHLERIRLSHGDAHIRRFLIARQKRSRCYSFHYLNEQCINALTKGVSMTFRKRLIVAIPEQVRGLCFLQER